VHRTFGSIALLTSALGAMSAIACSSPDGATTTVGVNDVGRACSITAEWTNETTQRCTDCKALVTTPKCACSDIDYGGKCSEQQSAVANEPSCGGVDACVSACAHTDCDCVEKCYADKATCRDLASARDGCVTEICDSHCR
jgi:hypothetical protein